MVAYDSRRILDPSQRLSAEVLESLREALVEQARAGQQPVALLHTAIRAAAIEATTRRLAAESLLVQLDELLDAIAVDAHGQRNRGLREWLIVACFRAYWRETTAGDSETS